MVSCIVRSVSRAARYSNWITAAATNSPFSTKIHDNSPDEPVINNLPNSKTSTPPWLILPPSYENKNMVYNFFSLTDNKLISINKREKEEEKNENLGLARLAAQPDDDADLVGSSHGWLVLRNNHDLFLSNPLTRRHIKLPSLPGGGPHDVKKVIISGSPDDGGCHAMMSFGPGARQLAVCCPGLCKEWTLTTTATSFDRRYKDYVYYYASIGVRNRFFICLADGYFEIWDLDDPKCPERDYSDRLDYLYEHNMDARHDKETDIMRMCRKVNYCVAHWDQIFVITRYVDGQNKETVGFDVHKFNLEELDLTYMDGGIDGLAFFVGRNHGFALSAGDYPGLKPDSVYYAEFVDDDDDIVENLYDVGIFNYRDRVVSPCYYPCDVQNMRRRINAPAPMWFTPSPF